MLYYDILDEVAEIYIPSEIHQELHVNPRMAWVETIADLIRSGQIKGSYQNIKILAKNWEPLLYKKFSTLN